MLVYERSKRSLSTLKSSDCEWLAGGATKSAVPEVVGAAIFRIESTGIELWGVETAAI